MFFDVRKNTPGHCYPAITRPTCKLFKLVWGLESNGMATRSSWSSCSLILGWKILRIRKGKGSGTCDLAWLLVVASCIDATSTPTTDEPHFSPLLSFIYNENRTGRNSCGGGVGHSITMFASRFAFYEIRYFGSGPLFACVLEFVFAGKFKAHL